MQHVLQAPDVPVCVFPTGRLDDACREDYIPAGLRRMPCAGQVPDAFALCDASAAEGGARLAALEADGARAASGLRCNLRSRYLAASKWTTLFVAA